MWVSLLLRPVPSPEAAVRSPAPAVARHAPPVERQSQDIELQTSDAATARPASSLVAPSVAHSVAPEEDTASAPLLDQRLPRDVARRARNPAQEDPRVAQPLAPRGLLCVTARVFDRRLKGDELKVVNVAVESWAAPRGFERATVELPFRLAGSTADVRESPDPTR
jgi:hypothetical protein